MKQKHGKRIELSGGMTVSFEGGITSGSVNPTTRGTTRSAESSSVRSRSNEIVKLSDMRLVGTAEVEVDAGELPTSRGGAERGEPRIVFEPPELDDDETAVLLTEDDGALHWVFRNERSNRYELDVAPDRTTQRGVFGSIVRKAVSFLAVKAIGPAAQSAAGSLAKLAEDRLRPDRVRTFTEHDFQLHEAKPPLIREFGEQPALLLLHGLNSSADETFRDLGSDWVAELNARYRGQVFAYDHPTLTASPETNARWLSDWLDKQRHPDHKLKLDILAYSRGGLVARELVERIRRDIVEIRSVVFVATPNNGTPLCDGKYLGELVDMLTNLAALVPDNPVTNALEIALELVKDVALDIGFKALPGIHSLAPSSDYLKELNELGRPDRTTTVYRAIAADFEPVSTERRMRRLRHRIIDRVFKGAMNDLLVPTRSVYLSSGGFAVSATERVVFDSSHAIDHAGFWANADVARQLAQWLRVDWDVKPPPAVNPEAADVNADIESAIAVADGSLLQEALDKAAALPAMFKGLVDAVSSDGVVMPAAIDPAKPAVVILPGIMGSLLAADDTAVWVSPGEIRRGAFQKLRVGKGNHRVDATGLNKVYTALAARLAVNWSVFLFPFDWRLDIFESADKLAKFIQKEVWQDGQRPVHLVAHSMGGLVSRAFAKRHRDIWNQMNDGGPGPKKGGRLVMLGTPNRGSFAIPLAFLGEYPPVTAIDLLDDRVTARDVADVIASMPGTYQMLPAPETSYGDDRTRLYQESAWRKAKVPVAPALLDAARGFHHEVEEVIDPDRLVYVAGDQFQTPARLKIVDGEFRFGRMNRGDGTVTHKSGLLAGVSTYFVNASHGDLISSQVVLDAIDDLLLTGKSKADGLSQDPFPRRGAVGESDDGDVGALLTANEVYPNLTGGSTRGGEEVINDDAVLDESMRLLLGGESAAPRQVLKVQVTHASLEQARHPVAVGHYRGIPAEGAEAFLDWRIDGRLSSHRALGVYPEEIGETLFVETPEIRPPGALVLGLGTFGELNRSKLVRAIQCATARRGLRAAERGLSDAGLSAVLIGTPGRYGLPISVCIAALIEGVARAALDLAELGSKVWISELEIVEFYETRATEAAEQARRVRGMLPVDVRSRIDLVLPEQLSVGRGGVDGAPVANLSGSPWARVEVRREQRPVADDEPQPLPSLRFTRLGRNAQADRLDVTYDEGKVEKLIAAAVRRPDAAAQTRALFELLFPHDAKLEVENEDNLHLLVTKETASVPWELLVGPGQKRTSAIALRTGMLRQVERDNAPMRSNSLRPVGNLALVVGDPPAGPKLPRLLGARREAHRVGELLEDRQFGVRKLVYDDRPFDDAWMEIQTALSQEAYRIVHFATHGEVGTDIASTGLVIGDGIYLTALDFKQMIVTPDLVFLNACHVGRTGAYPGSSDERVNEIAANLALTLMQNGVKAVIAAGWAVSDQAGWTFANTFYEQMFDGAHFGDAVWTARRATYDVDGGRTNTWGAYQCYGDPNFTLGTNHTKRQTAKRFVSAEALIRELEYHRVSAGFAREAKELEKRFGRLRMDRDTAVTQFPSPNVLHELAKTYSDFGAYADAVATYRRIEKAALGGELPLVVIEQLANIEARLARQKASSTEPRLEPHQPCEDEAESLFSTAKERLDALVKLEPTGERHAMLGSLRKKWGCSKRRKSSIKSAASAYREAEELEPKAYHGNLWIQMSALRDGRPQDEDDAKTCDWYGTLVSLRKEQETEKENVAKGPALDFWVDAAAGDLAVTEAVLGLKGFGEAKTHYLKAFRNRSSVAERDSVIDHLKDLRDLMEPDEAAGVVELIASLESNGAGD